MPAPQEKLKITNDTNYPIHNLLQQRWSPRAFSNDSVKPELLKQLFEAARWAPSSYNEQPWHFIAARKEDEEAFEKLSQVMNDFNRNWASKAPVLVLGLTQNTFAMNGNPNPHAGHDLGQAIAHLTFEATRHDLYVHQMAGIHPDKARELYDIPEDVEPMTMFAIGYSGEPEQLDDDLQEQEQAPNKRKPLAETVTLYTS
ncbi:nitroreductase family protein [Fodinibius halophilus]|uniref:Nitroreductase family protein n=1 Tax=Fodinibius halophilus TaxID=1736908 RepID=A0A6M1SVE2_9BACT|nr:nitroreductase family protein [Fodinibius halophilus]NGP87546.1 nitroreductase family protein [Fodinibius halophilus]